MLSATESRLPCLRHSDKGGRSSNCGRTSGQSRHLGHGWHCKNKGAREASLEGHGLCSPKFPVPTFSEVFTHDEHDVRSSMFPQGHETTYVSQLRRPCRNRRFRWHGLCNVHFWKAKSVAMSWAGPQLRVRRPSSSLCGSCWFDAVWGTLSSCGLSVFAM